MVGGYSGKVHRISFSQDPTFPGGMGVPVVGAGKTIYKVAAFFPKHVKLGPLSELGYLWVSNRLLFQSTPFILVGLTLMNFKNDCSDILSSFLISLSTAGYVQFLAQYLFCILPYA